MELLKKATSLDFPEAMNALAVEYFCGDNIGENPDEALRLWNLTAEKGFILV